MFFLEFRIDEFVTAIVFLPSKFIEITISYEIRLSLLSSQITTILNCFRNIELEMSKKFGRLLFCHEEDSIVKLRH